MECIPTCGSLNYTSTVIQRRGSLVNLIYCVYEAVVGVIRDTEPTPELNSTPSDQASSASCRKVARCELFEAVRRTPSNCNINLNGNQIDRTGHSQAKRQCLQLIASDNLCRCRSRAGGVRGGGLSRCRHFVIKEYMAPCSKPPYIRDAPGHRQVVGSSRLLQKQLSLCVVIQSKLSYKVARKHLCKSPRRRRLWVRFLSLLS